MDKHGCQVILAWQFEILATKHGMCHRHYQQRTYCMGAIIVDHGHHGHHCHHGHQDHHAHQGHQGHILYGPAGRHHC